MWMGIARAVEDISKERFARDEKNKDREFSRQQTLEDRQFELDLFQKKAAQRQEELLTKLRIGKAADRAAASNNMSHVQALAKRVEGAEGADEYISKYLEDPRAAAMAIRKVEEVEARTGREVTPQEFVDNIVPLITENSSDIVSTFDTELEQLMFESAVRERGRAEPVIFMEPSLAVDYDKTDVDMAEEAFTNRLVDLATEKLRGMSVGPEQGDLLSSINKARDGDNFAMADLRDQFGPEVAAEFTVLAQTQPSLRPIIQSPVYGQYMRNLTSTEEEPANVTQQETPAQLLAEAKEMYRSGKVSEEQLQKLRVMFPGEFD